MTDPLGQSQVIPYLAGLSKYGYEFTILSCDKPDLYKKHKEYVRQLIAPYPISWISIPYHRNPPVISSMYDLYMLKKAAAQLYKKEGFDMVHTRPGVPTLVALWLKKKYRIKFLNDIRGFWADERVDGGMWNLKNPLFKKIYSFFKEHEYECIEKADHNTCLTYKGREEMQNWDIPNQPIPIEVIPCSADMALFNPANINDDLKHQVKNELNIKDTDLIVSYLGSIGGWYLVDEMMRFFKILITKIPDIKILFISPHRHEVILATAKKYDIPGDRLIVKHAERHEVPLLLSISDYSLFFIKPCYSKISSSPTKHGEIMAMGIPVITNARIGDVEDITNRYSAGIVLKEFSEEEFTRASDLLASGIRFNRQAIIQGARDFYDLESAVQKYLEVYQTILGQ